MARSRVQTRKQLIDTFRKTPTYRYRWVHPQINEPLEVVAPDIMTARYMALAVVSDRMIGGRKMSERYWTAWTVYIQTTDPVQL